MHACFFLGTAKQKRKEGSYHVMLARGVKHAHTGGKPSHLHARVKPHPARRAAGLTLIGWGTGESMGYLVSWSDHGGAAG